MTSSAEPDRNRLYTPSSSGQRFAVIIVNYNGLDTLGGAVVSALREGVPESQILIVDNGSTDSSLAQLQALAPAAPILRNNCNAGFARAVNRGIRTTASEFLLLLNNDAELQPGALHAFAQAFDANPRLAIAGGQLRYPDGRLQSAFAPLPTLMQEFIPVNFLKWSKPERYIRSTDAKATREVESVFGACLAVRSAALTDIGLLDEDFFFYFEEVEWCLRALQHGWQVCYVAEARAMHLLAHTANRYRGDARIELQRSKLLYFRKHSSPLGYHSLSAYLAVRTFINALFGSLGIIFTLGLNHKLRTKTRAYWRMFQWHAAGRPESWGLPGKCPEVKPKARTSSRGLWLRR